MLPDGVVIMFTETPAIGTGGFPTLVVYSDGTVVSAGRYRPGQPREATIYQPTAAAIEALLSELAALAGCGSWFSQGTIPFDGVTMRLDFRCDSQATRIDGWDKAEPLDSAERLVEAFLGGLTDGDRYVASFALVQVARLEPEAPRDPPFVDWAPDALDLSRAPERGVVDVSSLFPLPDVATRPGAATVRVAPGEVYRVEWQPLLPHEEP